MIGDCTKNKIGNGGARMERNREDRQQFVFHIFFFRGATDFSRNIISRSRFLDKYRGKFCR